jgi:hypothetical protein
MQLCLSGLAEGWRDDGSEDSTSLSKNHLGIQEAHEVRCKQQACAPSEGSIEAVVITDKYI